MQIELMDKTGPFSPEITNIDSVRQEQLGCRRQGGCKQRCCDVFSRVQTMVAASNHEGSVQGG